VSLDPIVSELWMTAIGSPRSLGTPFPAYPPALSVSISDTL
jgi:hypothetical protein